MLSYEFFIVIFFQYQILMNYDLYDAISLRILDKKVEVNRKNAQSL